MDHTSLTENRTTPPSISTPDQIIHLQSSNSYPQRSTVVYPESHATKKSFDKAKQHYEDALKRSGHTTNFTYMTNDNSTPQQSTPSHHRKNRQRKIIWFNPPYSRNVQTNVGKAFLGLITEDSCYCEFRARHSTDSI